MDILKKVYRTVKYYILYFISLLYIKKNIKRVSKKIQDGEKITVLFIVQYIPAWNKLEPIYQKMKSNNRFNPVIVCVPINIENHILLNDDFHNETYEYFKRQNYECINGLYEDGEWVDLKSLHPDYVFHSRPYNYCMPKCYTSYEIKKYALLCNVLYGVNTTVNCQSSTLNSDYFKDVFCYFAFDIPDQEFYEKSFKKGIQLQIQKCFPYGAIGLEQMLKAKSEKHNKEFKKTVLWTPRWSTDPIVGGSNFFKYKETIRVLAEENQDIHFIIRPHPLMFNNFIKTGEMTKEEVSVFKEYCLNATNIDLDENKEYSDTFWKSDILITDNSGIVPEYFVTLKPIIFCHSDIFTYTTGMEKIIESSYQAFTSDDINCYFNDLVKNNDYMKGKRQETCKSLFYDIEKLSEKVLDVLECF